MMKFEVGQCVVIADAFGCKKSLMVSSEFVNDKGVRCYHVSYKAWRKLHRMIVTHAQLEYGVNKLNGVVCA
jgi:predicted transposase YbfD/YdcC